MNFEEKSRVYKTDLIETIHENNKYLFAEMKSIENRLESKYLN